ncbi:MAG: MMPL family transporter [Solirubrobacteraceae bacterium]
MTALTRWVLSHTKIVVGFWVVITLVGFSMMGKANDSFDQKFSVPEREGFATSEVIADKYGAGGENLPLLPTVQLPEGKTVDSPGVKADLAKIDEIAAKALPGSRQASYASTGDKALVSEDGRTVFSLVYPKVPDTTFGDDTVSVPALRAALKGVTVAGEPVRVTGFDALNEDVGGGEGPGIFIEVLFGGVGALAVLAYVFASLMAFLPLLMAIVAIPTTFLAAYGLTAFTSISPIVSFLIGLVGLGIAIDYALLIVVRWREERAHGLDLEEATIKSMATAGRAVLFSGTTVAIALFALIAIPLPFMRSMGYAGLLIPLISVAVAVTLLPVLLVKWGPRLDWPHKRDDDKASRAWTRWAEGIVRRRWPAALLALAILGALTVSAAGLNLGTSNPDVQAKNGDAKVALGQIKDSGIGSGALAPYELLASESEAPAALAATEKVDGIHGGLLPKDPDWVRDGVQIVEVIPSPNPSTKDARDLVAEVRDAGHSAGPSVKVGGPMPGNQDFIDAVYGNFPLLIALISIVTYILLARAFRSLLLPLKAVVLNIISVAAAWGVMTLVWQNGHGSQIWGIDPTGAIASWIPLMVFAFLFGLSMDYEVFILSRMREEYDATGETNTSVVVGLGRTGRLVTSAALILFLAFVAMASGPQVDVKVLATGLAAGILLDATVVRGLLVPAVVSLMGRWNWWLPPGPAKLLRVEPSEARSN